MMSITMKIILALILPCCLAFINLVWQGVHWANPTWPQVWTGLFAMGGLAYAAGLLPRPIPKPLVLMLSESVRERHPWFVWFLTASWTMLWTLAWLTLPTGNFLRLILPVAFFALVWAGLLSADADRQALRRGLVLTLAAILGWIGVWLLSSPFRRARLLEDWTGPYDVTGRHYQYAQVLNAWHTLKLWGPSDLPLAGARLNLPGTELLQLMAAYGALPGILLGVALVLAWVGLWNWLRRKACGPTFSAEMRRLGLALAALQGLASLLYVLFNFGLTPYPMGLGLPPLVLNAAWWMMGAALAWIGSKAITASRSQGAPVPAGKHGWISLSGYALTGSLLVITVLMVKENQAGSYGVHPGNQDARATRKIILDARDQVIAENVAAYDLWFTPSDFWGPSLLNPKEILAIDSGPESRRTDAERERVLLDALEKWPQIRSVVSARLASWPKSKHGLAILAWAITPELTGELKALAIPGLLMKPRTARHYPEGRLYAHALGFASLADSAYGQEGLEWVANRQLATASLSPRVKEDQGLRTTLVPDIQRAARETLQAGIKDHHATGGAIVVMDVRNNEIAAMVSAPDFDPNDLSTYRNPYQPDRILNRATSLSFPIGALITPLVVAHALESGRVTPTSKVNLGTGQVGKANAAVGNASVDGVMTVEDIVAKSESVGLGKLALQMPLTELQAVLQTLGIGEPLEIPGLPGGANARTQVQIQWTSAMQANPGQYTETNLMQVLKAYLPIATDGYLRTPTMLETPYMDLQVKRVLSTDTVASLRDMLKLAASEQGTAPLARVPGVSVAGKTSTMTRSFWRDAETGIKVSRSDTAAFVGMLPAEQPKWLVGILLEFSPGTVQYGGVSTAPIFAQLAHAVLLPRGNNAQ